MKLVVGQVLFVVLRKDNLVRVYPMQVVEEVSKKSMEGETTSYVIQGGSDPNTRVNLSDIDGEVFSTAAEAKQVLTARATGAISALVDNAIEKAREWYPTGAERLVADTPTPKALTKKKGSELVPIQTKEDDSDGDNIIELADGTKARVRNVSMPDVLK